MTDLDRLIEAVEGGCPVEDMWMVPKVIGPYPLQDYLVGSCNGSLDAAKALHEALLPGLNAHVTMDGSCQMFNEHGVSILSEEYRGGNPARAWLIAVLKVYRSTL